MENNIVDVMDINTEAVSADPEKLHTVLIVTFETTKKGIILKCLEMKHLRKTIR